MADRFGDTGWTCDHDNLVTLAFWLIERGDIHTLGGLQRYYEKPWKWTPEWEAMHAEAMREVAA
jgi:hypothetical protein